MTATQRPGPVTDAPGRRTADLLAFLDFAHRAGLLTQANAAAYRLGASRILSALPEHATDDVTRLNPEHAIAVFASANTASVSQTTCRQYAGSLRKALILFADYLADPERWHAKAAANSGAVGWNRAADGGLDLTIPLPRARAMRLHLPADVTENDARLARKLISSYLREITTAPESQE
ncbi:MAG TPA: hypothetical protein VL551_34085 [Actinospica sp.]|jgi:hypothetical protein|nr:hypothetical protein [Actinospica sp.]